MNNRELKAYLYYRLQELNQQKDMADTLWNGKISFGMDPGNYEHLPAWKTLVQKRKMMVRGIWIQAFILAMIVVGITSDIRNQFELNWVKALTGWLLLAVFVMVLFVIQFFYSVFVSFRNTEREIRKLIYQDLLLKLDDAETVRGERS